MFLFTFSAFRKMGDSTVQKPKLKPNRLHGCQGILFNSQYMKVLSMSNGKHRVWPGALVAVCLLAGLCCSNLLADNSARALADSEPAPDLIVESIAWSPELPAINNIMMFKVNVSNRGDYPASNYRLACFIDNNLVYSTWTTGINPGFTVEKAFTWKALAGPHVIKAVVDYDDTVAEIDESNNDSTYAFSALAADLVVSEISWVPENPSSGDKVTFTVAVTNQGDRLATASQISLFIDDHPRGYREIPYIEIGANRTAEFTWVAQPGAFDIKIEADRLNQVKEGDETNNITNVIYATAAPDLVVDSITWSPLDRVVGGNVTMTAKISNRGSGIARSSYLAFYVDDWPQEVVFLEYLKVGASITKTYSWKPGPGTHTLKAVADYSNELTENIETNNAMFVSLPAILPDLIIQNIQLCPVQPLRVDQVLYAVTVKNQGNYISGICELALHIDETYTQRQEVPALDAGETADIFFRWMPSADSATLRGEVDEEDIVTETKETNNSKTVKIGVPTSKPDCDLLVESMTWTPTNPTINDTVTITITIKNKGPGLAGPTNVDYYVDDVFLDSIYADSIGAGKTIVNSVVWRAEFGEHTIKAAVDCNNIFFEKDEENNEKSVTVAVAAPDLVIQDVTWSPLCPQAGEEVDFSLVMKNRGDYKAGSSYISYYVDGASRGRHLIEDIKPGDNVTRSFTFRAQSDSPVFKLVIDEGDDVAESDESNNEKTVFLPAPDLVIEGITRSPDNPSENATVTFIVSVRNLGAGPARSPHITAYIDDTFLASIQFNDINPGDSTTGACIWTAQNGAHIFSAVADADESITESDESNNEKSMKLSISQPMIEEPAQETRTETENTTTPTSTITTKNVDIVEMMLGDNSTAEEDIAGDISSTSPADSPWWQKILTNRFVIIGVAVLGIGALAVLFLFRRRSRKNQAVE